MLPCFTLPEGCMWARVGDMVGEQCKSGLDATVIGKLFQKTCSLNPGADVSDKWRDDRMIYLLDNLNNRRILRMNPAPWNLLWGLAFLMDLFVNDSGTIYVAELCSKKGVGLPPSATFTDLQCPGELHRHCCFRADRCRLRALPQSWGCLWISTTSWAETSWNSRVRKWWDWVSHVLETSDFFLVPPGRTIPTIWHDMCVCLVVWNMNCIFPNTWDDDPIWRTPSFFRGTVTNDHGAIRSTKVP